ncbi:MAG: hypothetical protein GSR78_02180 [Desulfurococcales archaeon]|nr:hypothetical protein [Desulfurococcales archaeon]
MVEAVGVFKSYTRGGGRQYTNAIVTVSVKPGILVGGKATLVYGGRTYKGRILREHGKHAVVVRFKPSPPGQALGSKVKLEKS